MNSWQEIEKNINDTKRFLKNNIEPSPFNQEDSICCRDCILRYISILIVSGRVKAIKISSDGNLWSPYNIDFDSETKHHGSEWHNSMINKINSYFLLKGYLTEKEPNLYFGKADVCVKDLNIYVEVGTVNIYKLLINLIKLKNCSIIIMPCDDYILEFSL